MGQEQAVRIEDSGWRFGFNIGGAYQGVPLGETDRLDPGFGMGFGFTIGHMLYQRRGDALNLGLRGRFLWETTSGMSTEPHYAIGVGQSWKDRYDLDLVGQNYQDEAGYVFPNYRQEGRQYDLELTLGLNRLAERTNLYLYLFGGVGVINYNVHTDQLNEEGEPYDYSALSDDPSEEELEDMWDGDHETMIYEGGKVNRFIPSGGIGMLYQINPSLGIGIEHKVSFPHKEDLFDAKEFRNAGPDASFGEYEKTARNDIYHYTALKLRWRLISKEKKGDDQGGTSSSSGSSTEPEPIEAPKVEVRDPSENQHRTRSETYPLRAKLHHVDKQEDVALWVNGDRVGDFDFDPNTGLLEKDIPLQRGGNQVMVQGVNEAGQDKDRVMIIHLEEAPDPPAPKVRITDPQQDPETYFQPTKKLEADLLNVGSKEDIEFRFNGSEHAFHFDPSSGVLTADLQLIQGANTVHVKAENEGGEDDDERTLIFERKAQADPPRVSIGYPNQDPEVVLDPNKGVIQATVENVESRSQLTVTQNGSVIHDYQFYPQSDLLTLKRPLQPGSNLFRIKARNEGGTDQAQQRIILEDEQKNAPEVDFIYPSSNGQTVSSADQEIKVRVRHVSKRQNVELKMNGNSIGTFQFDHTQALLTYTATLEKGNNRFQVRATNSQGSASDQVSIRYEEKKKAKPPRVRFQKPSRSVSENSSGKAELKARVTNVQDASDIQVFVNGSPSNKFNFDPAQEELTLQKGLIKGQNRFTVKANTPQGSDQDQRIIHYDPADPPAVKITKPFPDPHTSSKAKVVIKGKVTGIDDASDLELKANGTKVNSFQFVSGLFKYQMSLDAGKNDFEVTASNPSGTASDAVVIHYKPSKPSNSGGTQPGGGTQPSSKQGKGGTGASTDEKAEGGTAPRESALSVRIEKPTASQSTVKGVRLEAEVKNANNVDVSVNGNSIPYDRKGDRVNANVPLEKGSNQIIVKASSKDGKVSDSHQIDYQPVKEKKDPKGTDGGLIPSSSDQEDDDEESDEKEKKDQAPKEEEEMEEEKGSEDEKGKKKKKKRKKKKDPSPSENEGDDSEETGTDIKKKKKK